MKNRSFIIRGFITSLTIFLVLFTYGCPETDTSGENSSIEVRITEKKFSLSTCSDNVSEAVSIEIRTILQNTSEVSGTIEDWKIDFYKDAALLFTVNKSNYESFACADQAIDISDEIVTSGFFSYYGFVQYSLLNNTIPNIVTIILTIKDNSGYTYQITDTF